MMSMSSVSRARRVVFNALRRLKFMLLTLALLGLGVFFILEPHNSRPEPGGVVDYDIMNARSGFQNPIYKKWIKRDSRRTSKDVVPISQACTDYFTELSRVYPGNPGSEIVDLEWIQSVNVNADIYKKSKWIRERKRSLRLELHKIGKRVNDNHLKQLEEEFVVASKELSKFESKIFEEFNHIKVFGTCYLEKWNETSSPVDKLKKLGTNFEKRLYPWISGELPRFENWRGDTLGPNEFPEFDKKKLESYKESEVFTRNLQGKSNGKGIVIPLLPVSPRDKQIENITRLIKVLRAMKNQFPIEVMHLGDLTKDEMKKIAFAARTDISRLPSSYKKYLELKNKNSVEVSAVTNDDYPKQIIWFADLTPVKNKQQHPLVSKAYSYNSPNFVLSMSTIFNSFEESIVLGSSSIPLVENLGKHFFENDSYKQNGILFFKNPSHYTTKVRRFPPGFHEVTNFIRAQLMPSQEDAVYFGINMRDPEMSPTNRVFEEGFQDLLDPSVMVINKSKVLSGLLISSNFQLYKIFTTRFESIKDELNPEFLWVGQEIAGTNDRVNFNNNYAVSVGILTPEMNKPSIATMAQELCSSSWGQLSDVDDFTLLYVTSHHLENWRSDNMAFQLDLKAKFTTKEKEKVDNIFKPGDQEKTEMIRENSSIFQNKIVSNPLYIESIMRPPTIRDPIFSEGFREPSQAWIKQEEFGAYKGNPYWCSYDVVGNPVTGERGTVINLSDVTQAWYKFILDVWYRDEHQDEENMMNEIIEEES
ncbi:mannosyltransferase putative-domain-containing protein [Scheffersomyces xylosifermentans]|uniref:mannosyltransferase putative-domain-containing protein n=1 Tax=Scheffersomyces xylosifermentans TaxID=1304137 RepID=UPI00315D2FF6